MSREQIQKAIAQTRKLMEKAAKELDFMEAARLRDEMKELETRLKGME
jgi:excinuclease ABC subunit B